MKKSIVAIMALLLFFSGAAYAQESDMFEMYSGGAELPQYYAEEYLADETLEESAKKAADGESILSFKEIGQKFVLRFKKEWADTLKLSGRIILIVILFYAVTSLSFYEDHSKTIFIACYAIVCSVLFERFSEAANVGKAAISSAVAFIDGIVPVIAVMTATGGAAVTASSVNAIVLGAVAIISNCLKWVIFPLAYTSVVLAIAGNISDGFSFCAASDFLKKAIKWTTGALLTVFTGILGVQGFTSSSLDAAVAKTAKFVVGSGIPVVGGVLSDSVETMASCSSVIKSATGYAGVAALLSICFVPAIKMAAICLSVHFASAVCEPFCEKRMFNVIKSVADAISLMTGLLIAVGIMLIICIAMLMSFGIRG